MSRGRCSPQDKLHYIKRKTEEILLAYKDNFLEGKESILSENTKTGYSINFPPAKTCTCATNICKKHCYAADPGKPITWKNSILKQLKVYNYFLTEKTEVIAARIMSEIHRKNIPWIRWNGSGDLFIQSVKVINLLARMDTSVKHVVVTRNVRLAKLIRQDLPNIFIGFSLDRSRVSKKRKKSLDKFGHPRLHYTYLREFKEENTMGASIIFNVQNGELHKEKFYKQDKGRHCPVDAGLMAKKDGCNNCKKCFSEKVLGIK